MMIFIEISPNAVLSCSQILSLIFDGLMGSFQQHLYGRKKKIP